jgi:hypothetical protein
MKGTRPNVTAWLKLPKNYSQPGDSASIDDDCVDQKWDEESAHASFQLPFYQLTDNIRYADKPHQIASLCSSFL